MWHTKKDGSLCHAWDVEASEYEIWKQGLKALSRSKVRLPNGHSPGLGSPVRCGTCHSPDVMPTQMTTEFVRT